MSIRYILGGIAALCFLYGAMGKTAKGVNLTELGLCLFTVAVVFF